MIPQVKNKKQDNQRKALLAKVHIAVNQLGIEDEDYRDIIEAHFPGKRSAGKLNNGQLNKLLRYFEAKGFIAKGVAHGAKGKSQVNALKEKARVKLESSVDAGFVRDSRGLVKKICGVDDLEWAGDAVRLKRLLAALSSIEQSAKSKGVSNES